MLNKALQRTVFRAATRASTLRYLCQTQQVNSLFAEPVLQRPGSIMQFINVAHFSEKRKPGRPKKTKPETEQA